MIQYYLHIVQIDSSLGRKRYAELNSYTLNLKCSPEKLRWIDYYFQPDELTSSKISSGDPGYPKFNQKDRYSSFACC